MSIYSLPIAGLSMAYRHEFTFSGHIPLYDIYHFPCFIQHSVDVLFADGVVPASIVISSIFLAGNELIRVE